MAEACWSRFADKRPADKVLRQALLASGIPEELRSKLWMQYSGAFARSKRGVYQDCVERSAQMESEHAQIEMDIARSGVNDAELQAKLRRVLRAWTAHSPHIGYVQGQNFICALRGADLRTATCCWRALRPAVLSSRARFSAVQAPGSSTRCPRRRPSGCW